MSIREGEDGLGSVGAGQRQHEERFESHAGPYRWRRGDGIVRKPVQVNLFFVFPNSQLNWFQNIGIPPDFSDQLL